MAPHEAGNQITALISVTREDIARAKTFVLSQDIPQTDTLVENWLKEQAIEKTESINTNSPECSDRITAVAKAYSLRIALYQAVWELIGAGELFPSGPSCEWRPSPHYSTSHGSGGIPVPKILCPYPPHIYRPYPISGTSTDPDIFLQGIECGSLHPGIREAIEQSLSCFKRGLYMPATVMMAAAVEAAWIECGIAIAKKLALTKLEAIMGDQYVGISKKIAEVKKTLESNEAKDILKQAGQSLAKVNEAASWTTILRERRNALHWDKAKGFIVEHSDTASLMLGAPIHLETLESLRLAC